MKLTTNTHKADVLELSETDLELLMRGNTLQTSALQIRKEREPEITYYEILPPSILCKVTIGSPRANLKLTQDPYTGKLLNAEVLR